MWHPEDNPNIFVVLQTLDHGSSFVPSFNWRWTRTYSHLDNAKDPIQQWSLGWTLLEYSWGKLDVWTDNFFWYRVQIWTCLDLHPSTALHCRPGRFWSLVGLKLQSASLQSAMLKGAGGTKLGHLTTLTVLLTFLEKRPKSPLCGYSTRW